MLVLEPAKIDASQTASTVTTTSITIDSVVAATGVNTDFGIKSVGGNAEPDSSVKTVTGLDAGTCYVVSIVLFCNSVEGDATEQEFCTTDHEQDLNSHATSGVTVNWPMVVSSLILSWFIDSNEWFS